MIGFEGAGLAAALPAGGFADDVVRGLSAPRKALAPKWLYDARGSALYELICDQPEYYPPRIETGLLETHAREIAEAIGPDALLFEYGAGSARKTALLVAAMTRPAAYVPVDISREALLGATEALGRRFPRLSIRPVVADFSGPVALPLDVPSARRVAFFPGSTIGNLDPPEAVAFLRRMAAQAGRGGALVIGVDLPKEEAVLVRAYDDARGVTAAFDLNLLARINRELEGDFPLSAFRHRARGETIHTESAYKWEPRAFDALAAIAGWRAERTWTDEKAWFAVKLYVAG